MSRFIMGGQKWTYIWNLIKEKLKCYNVLLSDERWFFNYEQLLEGVLGETNNIKIILYIRPQYDFLESYYKERLRWKDYKEETFDCFIKGFDMSRLNYEDIVEKVTNLIGKDNLILRLYEKERLSSSSIYDDFIGSLDSVIDVSDMYKPDVINKSLEGINSQLQRLMNGLLKDRKYTEYKRYNESLKKVNSTKQYTY